MRQLLIRKAGIISILIFLFGFSHSSVSASNCDAVDDLLTALVERQKEMREFREVKKKVCKNMGNSSQQCADAKLNIVSKQIDINNAENNLSDSGFVERCLAELRASE